MTQAIPALTRPAPRPSPRSDRAGSLYLGLQPPARGPLTRLLLALRPVLAQPRHTTSPHLLAVGTGGRDLDLAATLLRPQALYSLARGEQVIGMGNSEFEVETRLRLAQGMGRRAAIACFPKITPQAATLLAAYPDLHLLVIGEAADVPADLGLPAHRILRAWDDADLVEVLSPDPRDVQQTLAISSWFLNRWLMDREVAQRREAQRPALFQIDLISSAHLPSIPPVGLMPGVQLVLHAMTWDQLEVAFGAEGILKLTSRVTNILTTGETPPWVGEYTVYEASGRLQTSRLSDVHIGGDSDPYTAAIGTPFGLETVYLPPLEQKAFAATRQGRVRLLQPDFPRLAALLSVSPT